MFCNNSQCAFFLQGRDKYQFDTESSELRAQIDILKVQHETFQSDIKIKDDRIQQLLKDIHSLEERCAESDHNLGQAAKMQDDMVLLETALREIAQALIQDAEIKDLDITPPSSHVHLSASTSIPQK